MPDCIVCLGEVDGDEMARFKVIQCCSQVVDEDGEQISSGAISLKAALVIVEYLVRYAISLQSIR